MRFIPTGIHGALDYLTVGALVAAPRVFGWGKPATSGLTAVAAGTLGYSLLTKYELGLFKRLPMPGHLALDAVSGAALCVAPFLPPLKKKRRNAVMLGFLAFGLFEIATSLISKVRPAWTPQDVWETVAESEESLAATIS